MAVYYVTNDREFNRAENYAPDWSQIILKTDAVFGTHYIDNDKLTIKGHAIFDADGATYALMIAASNIHVYGPDITGSRGSGVSIQNATDVTLTSVNVYDNVKHGIYANKSDRIKIQASDIHDNDLGGISIHIPKFHGKAGFITIIGNDIFDNGLEGTKEKWSIIADYDFWRRDTPEYHPKFSIINNTIKGNGSALLAFHADNMIIRDNDFMFNNVDRDGPSSEVRFLDSVHNIAVRNIFHLEDGDRPFSFEEGSRSLLSKNTLADPYHDGGSLSLHDDHWTF